MKSGSHFIQFCTLLLAASTMFGCGTNPSNAKYEIASDEYANLTESYLQHVGNFEWEESYAYLANNVVFKLPDGDADRTTFEGIDNVKGYWNSYVEKSGNDKTTLSNFVHIPVQVNEIIEHVNATGVFDICYFSAELNYGTEKANVRMHWAFHFNDEKKIDLILAYFDRTPIIEAANRNFLVEDPGEQAE